MILFLPDLLQDLSIDQGGLKVFVLLHFGISLRSFEVLIITNHVQISIRILVAKLETRKIYVLSSTVIQLLGKGLLHSPTRAELRDFDRLRVVRVDLRLSKSFLSGSAKVCHSLGETKLSNSPRVADTDIHLIYYSKYLHK